MLFGRKTASEAAQEQAPAAAPPQQPLADSGLRVNTAAAPIVHKRLGQMLIEEGLLTTTQLEKALEEQARTGEFLGKVLVTQGVLTQSAVSSCLVKQCKIPHLNLLDYEISSDVLALIPEEVCRRHHLLPIDKLGRILTVAMVDPLDTEAMEEIRRHCGELKIKPILCNWEHYETVSAKVYGGRPSGEMHAVTAEGLGLGHAPTTSKASDPSPTPIPPSKLPSPSDSQLNVAVPAPTAAAPPPAPTVSPQQIAAAVSDTLRDTVREGMREMAAALQREGTPAAPGVSTEEISTAIRGAMADAMSAMAQAPRPTAGPNMDELGLLLRRSVQEAVSAVAAEMRPGASVTATPAAVAPDFRELGEVLRTSVQEAVSAATRQMQPAAAGAPAITPEQIGAAIQESVGNAMQEAMAVMVTQLKAMAPRREEGHSEALVGAVREALAATAQAQQEQGNRLAEIAQATLQSVQQTTQLIESTQVRQQGERDLRGPGGRHASVSTFRGSSSGTMDEDGRVVEALENNRPAEFMTFDTYVPGAVNAFTFKVCQQIAAKPGGDFNPLFIFGHVGAGKTHLISAIGNHILKASPKARVGYVSASHFARRMKEAMTENALDAFREHYAHWDVLILDDIQFLAGRVEAQEEFFHIFNALHQQGRQIIIASDKAPDRLGLLEQRLISRFASGIVTELKAPEWEARMAILKQLAQQANVKVPEPVLSLIAMRVSDDVRKLTGCLRKVIAFAQMGGQELTVEMAEQILSHLSVEAAA